MARLFARFFALVLGISAFAAADAQTYTYTFYVGNTNSNGCTVQTPAGPVDHVKWRLQATVTGGAAPSVGAVTRADCSNNVFGASSAVASTSAVGLNTVPGGLDTFEVQLPVGVVGPTPSPREVLAVVASSGTGSDGLIATVFGKGATAKGTIPGGVTPVTIPTAGVLALAVLGLVLAAVAWRALRRRGHLLMLSLLLIAGSAWAIAIVVDGQVGDWAGVTGNTDAAGDSGGQAAIDLRALYVTTQGPNGYVRVDVTDLENPPVADATTASVLEDGNVAITLTGSDPNNAPLTFQIASPPALGTLGAITPIDATSAGVTYTPNADENGSDAFTFTVSNGTQTSTPATVSIAITSVNDAPSFTAANPPAVNEGAGAQSVAGWATFDAGPANESSQAVLAYHVSSVSAPALFAAGPAVDASGTLTYTLAAEASGTATFDVAVQDDGGAANGGVDTSATQSFTLTVGAVNDAPVFTGGGNASALEDAGAQNVAGWATGIDDGDADQTQSLAFQVTGNTNAALFASGPAIDAVTGDLSFTPAADANGSATVTVVLVDDGGTANGGADTSASYDFDISITAVNDAPSFTAVDPPAVNEGAGAQSVPNWATFSAGPANEAGQAVAEYQVSAIGNPGLFAVAPSVANDGTLSYTVAANVSGSSTFSVAVRDDGGTANGGVDLSASQVFTVTVNAVNSAPSFTGGGDVAGNEDAGPQSFTAWATAIDDGDLDQVQTLSFTVTGNTNPALFAAGPAVDAGSGDLTWTAAPEASGSATITLVLSDDGGTANGGDDTSAPYDFTITVNPVNDAPTATAKVHATHSAIELEIVAASHAGELLEGAADVDDPAGELTAEYVAGSATPAGAQVVVTNAADGSFRYDPPGGYSGAGSFQFRVCDDGVPSAPQQCSAPTTVTFTITGPDLYFVDDNAAPGGDGGLNDPLASVSELPAARGSNDRIFVFAGNYAAAHAFSAGEHLVGQGATGAFDSVFGVAVPANGALDARPALTGQTADRPALDRIVMADADNATMRGVALSSGSADAVDIDGSSGVTIAESSAASSAGGVNIDGSSASGAGVTFDSVTSSGGANGIALNDVSGSFDFGTGSLTGNTGVSFLGTGTLGTVSYAGNIAKNTAGNIVELNGDIGAGDTGSVALSGTLSCTGCSGVDIVNRDAGTLAFSGSAKTLDTGAETAVNLDNNDGATIDFTGGGLDLGTTTGAGFRAVNGAAAITVQGTGNVVDSVSGTALQVSNSTIGAGNVTFERLSAGNDTGAADPVNGIVLDGTGASGGLIVTGNSNGICGGSVTVNAAGTPATLGAPVAADCTGGTIQSTTAAGIVLNNTANVSLTRMRVRNPATDGVQITGIDGFTLANSHISDSAGVAGDRGIEMGGLPAGTAVNGAISIVDSTVGPTPHDNFAADIGSGTSAWTVSGTVFDDSQSGNGFNLDVRNATVSSFLVDGSVFRSQFGDGLQMRPASGAAATIASATIQDSSFTGNNIGMDLNHDGTSNLAYKVLGNTFQMQAAQAINFFSSAAAGTGGTLNGRIVGNHIGDPAIFNSGGGTGIRININGGADTSVLVDSNVIRQIPNGRGIELISRNGTGGTDATVTNNQVDTDFVPTDLNGGFSLSNIFLQSNCLPNCNTLRSDIRGNTVPGVPPTSELVAGQLVLLRTGLSTNQLVDNAPASLNALAELQSQNTGSIATGGTITLIPGPITTPP